MFITKIILVTGTIYLRETIVLFTVRTIPTISISVRHFCVCVTKPAVHGYWKTWPEMT